MKFLSRVSVLILVGAIGLASVNCGGASHDVAPNGEETGGDGGLDTPIVFATVTDNVFNKYGCLNCQGAVRKAANIDLSSYESIMSHPRLVNLNADPAENLIVKVIALQEMPPRGAPVSRDDLNLLIDWIAAGAPKE